MESALDHGEIADRLRWEKGISSIIVRVHRLCKEEGVLGRYDSRLPAPHPRLTALSSCEPAGHT